MKKLISFFSITAVILSLSILGTSCKKDEPVTPTPSEKVPIVSQFVYDGMSELYLWADRMKDKQPTISDIDPEKYFKSILYSPTDKWSWITDDAKELVAGFAGEPKSFGYHYSGSFFMPANEERSQFYYIIGYVYPNSPAEAAGLKRLDLIGKINGNPITENNYGLLFGDEAVTLTIYQLTEKGITQEKDVYLTPITIKTNPVFFDDIYTIGDKKIGYLFYTSFISNYNNQLFDVFSKFKQEGVTDLVLDLRYNHGGDISAATYLSSMIAPLSMVKEKPVFTMLSYNDDIGQNKYHLGTYVEEDIIKDGKVVTKAERNPLDANLDLDKVYIIATGDSYSASELTAFCLRQFVNVLHIGGKTGGKYTASITVHAYDNKIGFPLYPSLFPKKSLSNEAKNALQNWAMQPIVARYTDNKSNDFIKTDGLIPDIEMREGFGYIDYWTPIGDTKDTFLGQAIYAITKDESYKPTQPQTRGMETQLHKLLNEEFKNPKDIRMKSVILDNFKIE